MNHIRPTYRNAEPGLDHDEIRALAILSTGVTCDAAARELGTSPRTVRRRVRRVCDRLDVDTPIQAIVWAAKRGFI